MTEQLYNEMLDATKQIADALEDKKTLSIWELAVKAHLDKLIKKAENDNNTKN